MARPCATRRVTSRRKRASARCLASRLAENLEYQDYRSIRFDPGHALWHGQGLRFTAEFFHRGFLYKEAVRIFEVANGRAELIRYSPDLFTFGKVKPRPPTSASPVSACITRSSAPITSTRSAPFSVPAIFARWRRTRATACRREASRSRPRILPARKSRRSVRSGWSGLERAATRSWFTRCWTARVRRRRSASPSAPASKLCSTPRWRCTRGPTLPLWASRRSPRCSCSTPTTARASMTIVTRCTIRADCCCGPARASRSGVRSPIRASCRSASSPTAARAASG